MVVGYGVLFLVLGYVFLLLVRLPFLMEDFSISKANLTKNPKTKNLQPWKNNPKPKPKTMNNNP